jgi:hypothetical protein
VDETLLAEDAVGCQRAVLALTKASDCIREAKWLIVVDALRRTCTNVCGDAIARCKLCDGGSDGLDNACTVTAGNDWGRDGTINTLSI